MSIRFDSIKMPKVTKTSEGYLRGEVVVSRAGVFNYGNSDGSIRGELRHPEEIFKKDSLDTLKMIPITNNHPNEFVNSENSHKYQVGYTGEHYDVLDDKVIVSITVTHQDAIDSILNGKLELSMGYDVSLQKEQGKYNGQNYDYRQIDPKYNHLAIVEKGRAGSEARFRFDSAYEQIDTTKELTQKKQGKDMNEEVNNMDNAARIDALNAEKELLSEKMSKLQSRLDLAESSYEKMKKELNFEKQSKADDIIEKRVMDRVELFLNAAPFLQDIEAYIKHTDREIMEATMNSVRTDSLDYSDRSDDHVRGMFENFIKGNTPRVDSRFGKEVFGVLSQRHDMEQNASMHDLIAKRAKEDWKKKQYGDK